LNFREEKNSESREKKRKMKFAVKEKERGERFSRSGYQRREKEKRTSDSWIGGEGGKRKKGCRRSDRGRGKKLFRPARIKGGKKGRERVVWTRGKKKETFLART